MPLLLPNLQSSSTEICTTAEDVERRMKYLRELHLFDILLIAIVLAIVVVAVMAGGGQ